MGSDKIANIVASEIAVFYYIFYRRAKAIDYKSSFTCYKENGIVLVLSTFLFVLFIETVAMHFLFLLLNKTTAWILTTLSFYTCLQLFAHIRALKTRPIILTNTHLFLRNGLMGGDALTSLDNIEKIEMSRKVPVGVSVIKLALIKGMENHNLAITLTSPVTILKAFGIKKTSKVLLINIDKPAAFIETLENHKLLMRTDV